MILSLKETGNTSQQLHIAPDSCDGIDARQDMGQCLLLAHQRRAAQLATTMLMMQSGARVLVDAAEVAAA